jgi:hypothetical protein
MRQLDNANVTVVTAESGVRTIIIEAATGEQFSVELSSEKAHALGTDILKEPAAPEIVDQPVEPQQPAPDTAAIPETTAKE